MGLDMCLGYDWTKSIVILSAGGNDLGKTRSKELLKRFKVRFTRCHNP